MILFSCKPEAEKPTVVTKSVGEVTETTAKVVGQVAADGGADVTERGVCWNTAQAPEVIDYRTVDGTGIGTFNSNISDLVPNTQYYVRAYATNEKGVSYGEELTFTTKKEIELPEVKTAEVEDITESEAVSGGEVISDGCAEVTARGICWSTKQNPTIEDDKTADGTGVGSFTSNLSNLEPQTTYYVRAYATNEKGTAYGEEVSFTTEEVEEPEDPENPEQPVGPVIITAEVTEITVSSAVCGGEVVSGGDAVVIARGICYNTTGAPTVSDTYTMDGTNIGVFISTLSNLDSNTAYYVRAYATDAKGVTSYGEEVTFTTLEKLLPTVTTATEVTDITLRSAKCGGEVTFNGNVSVTARGICWSTSHNPTIEDNKTTDGSGVGIFTSNLSNLEHNTTYYVRAYATNEKGTAYGEEVSFTTEEVEEPEEPGDEPETPEQPEEVAPEVTTSEVTGITVNSAVCGGEVVDGGDAVVVARGVCWNTSGTPTVSDTYTMDGSNIGSYTSNMTNLEHNTTYYVRAYATNAKGVTGYGEEVIFTTLEKLLPTVTTATEVTGITVSKATCGGEVTFDGNVTVTARGICWSTSQNPTIEDNKTEDGNGIGSYTSNMTNLELNTTYYVRAYATNEVGAAYGEEVTFTTLERNANGREYIDLGLSVKWATCNVGATSPEEYGDYYAWGETTTKETYNYGNCLTYGLSYSSLQSQGYIDSEGNLTAQYDAARTNWGGTWRMPTYDELNELNTQCTWEWINTNDFKGYKVTGPNGNSIFLPAARSRYGSSLNFAGSDGVYLSSTPNDDNSCAYGLYFSSGGHGMGYGCRYYGHSVRPVIE